MLAPDEPRERAELLRARLRLGVDPGDRDLAQPVALREVAEGGVARDDLPARAALQASPVPAIERAQVSKQRGGGPVQRGAEPPHDLGEEDRIEPDVRIGAEAGLLSFRRLKRQSLQDVDDAAARLGGGLADGRLEAVAEVQDDVGALDSADRSRRQLEVVRLGAGRREVVDLVTRSADPLGRVRQRIEGGNDRLLAARGGRAAAGQHAGRQHDNENDSRH